MKLLILTQVVDRTDTALSFFHSWIEAMAPKFERIDVICLKEGEYDLPGNVRVYSLGKEGGRSRIKYVTRFYRYIWHLRGDYDAVFVHMNQEYVLLGGWLWKLMGKHVYLWRNYHAGNWGTDIAALFCTKVFCTSAFSYTAKYKKTVLMPVGANLSAFTPAAPAPSASIVSFGLIVPPKRIEIIIDALGILAKRGVNFVADIVGDPLPQREPYRIQLKTQVENLGLQERVRFAPGVPNREAVHVFRAHQIFINASPSGMYDKMLFEAAASGCLVLASSGDWARIADKRLTFDGTAESLANALQTLFALPESEKSHLREHGAELAHSQSLEILAQRLSEVIY
jgi:glycosyltransferase involved in cell wall biosynthesis